MKFQRYLTEEINIIDKSLKIVRDMILSSKLTPKKLTPDVAKYLRQTVTEKKYKLYRGIGIIKNRVAKQNIEILNNLQVEDKIPEFLSRQVSTISSYTKKKIIARRYSEGTIEIVVQAEIPSNKVLVDLENLEKLLKGSKQKILDSDDFKYFKTDKEVFVKEPIVAKIISIKGKI